MGTGRFGINSPIFNDAKVNLETGTRCIYLPRRKTVAVGPAGVACRRTTTVPFKTAASLFFLESRKGLRDKRSILVCKTSKTINVTTIRLTGTFNTRIAKMYDATGLSLMGSLKTSRIVSCVGSSFARDNGACSIVFSADNGDSFSNYLGSLGDGKICLETIRVGLSPMLQKF